MVVVAATPEDAVLKPASVYAVTKLSQEQLVLSVAKSLDVSAIAMRYQNVYGPGQSLTNPYTGILSIFSREMVHGRPIEIFEDGLESRDFVHVEDVAQSNVSALELGGLHNVAVNVGTGESCAVLDVARKLLEVYGSRSDLRISGRFRAGDIRHNRADVSRLRSLVGRCPEIRFEQGILTFCEWARAQLSGEESSASGYAGALKELESRGLMKGGPATP
jgi:dTDP-L-rhamnose 4-epimerase